MHDVSRGEFARDLGGSIPWTRYADPAHPFAAAWSSLASPPNPTFADFFAAAAVDFGYLDSVTSQLGIAGMSVIPRLGVNAFEDPAAIAPPPGGGPAPTLPLSRKKWWIGASGSDEILFWPYVVNGAPVMVCAAGNGSGVPLFASQPPPAHVSMMVHNYYFHPSQWGSNKSRFSTSSGDQDGYRQEFSVLKGGGGAHCEAWWDGGATGPWLGPKEQAIDAGDIVVLVQENFGMSIPVAIQRNQEAVAFVKREWANGKIAGLSPSFVLGIDGAYLHGTSYGQGMSMILGLLMPTTFNGSTEWITDDVAFWNGDSWELQYDFDAAMNRGGFAASTNTYFPDLWALVDQLGCRFDEAKPGVQPWDLAILSMNQRAAEVQIPLIGHVGDHEVQFSAGWPSDTPSLNPGKIELTLYRNRAHTEHFGVIPGVNEFGIYDGGEWGRIKGTPGSTTRNRLVPNTAPPSGYPRIPDPYSPTLRKTQVPPLATMPSVLATLDLREGMKDSWLGWPPPSGPPPKWCNYRHPSVDPIAHNLRAIGQGIWPGYRDQMRVADLDGDGRMEVVFGNLDGYVHILEFAGSNDPGDPYRLVDEWRSPFLGRAIFACDALFAGGRATLFFANGRGEIVKFQATAANQYSTPVVIASPDPATTPPTPKYLYDGSTPLLLVGNIDGGAGSSGAEVLVMNRYFDWSLFTTSGTKISNGRLPRHGRAVGPADVYLSEAGAVGAFGADPEKEVIVAAADSMVWMLDRKPDPTTFVWQWTQPIQRITPFTGLVLGKAVPCHFNGNSQPPTQLLLFGSNSDRDDGGSGHSPSVIQLWQPALNGNPAVLLAEIDSPDIGFDETMSFAWIIKPSPATQGQAVKFAVASETHVATYTAGPGGTLAMSSQVVTLADEADDTVSNVDVITSLECASLDNGSGPSAYNKHLIYATSKGRIYVCDAETLAPLRSSSKEVDPLLWGGLPGAGFNPAWPSNRTLAQTPASTLVTGNNGSAEFYFAETALNFRENSTGGNMRYRIGGVSLGSANLNSWHGFTTEANERAEWRDLRPQWIRTLTYDDLDPGVAGSEFRMFAETGCAFYDARTTSPLVREFQTVSWQPDWMTLGAGGGWGHSASNDPWIFDSFQGGYVFERLVRSATAGKTLGSKGYRYLGGFTAPADPTHPFFDRTGGAGGNGWWYPKLGSNYMTGQIASTTQSAHPLSLGSSMKMANLWSQAEGAIVPQIVTGTSGGYVYSIRPSVTTYSSAVNGMIPGDLVHVSPNLGSDIIGLDVGDLDLDGDQEIACGSWLDDGSFVDWTQWKTTGGSAGKNRGHLYLLDPVHGSAPSTMTKIDLQADDLFGPGNGIGSGVFGVKIDNVDGVGRGEVWCGDAAGYIYLFGYDASPVAGWRCVYRSERLCPYPGAYNNIHPIKGAEGKTVKLLVQAPGYLMLFSVDHAAVPRRCSDRNEVMP